MRAIGTAAHLLSASAAVGSTSVGSRASAFRLPIPRRCPPLAGVRSPPAARRLVQPMTNVSARSLAPNAVTGDAVELRSAADFDAIAVDGRVSILGFGSLLSERSARSTFPELSGFRVALLRGFRRVFAHAAPVFFQRGIANLETKEFSSLSVEPCDGEVLVVTVFEISTTEVPAFIERENEFRFLAVVPEGLDGTPSQHPAVVCARYSDDEYFHIRCQGNKEIYDERYGKYGIDRIWRDDILPCRLYLRHCVLAARGIGEPAHSNFLDHTFLADRRTRIREYLENAGAGIMEEEPPEALSSRYGG